MTEKSIEKIKQVSVKIAEAACRASFYLGMADTLALAGLALIGVSCCVRTRINVKDHLKT